MRFDLEIDIVSGCDCLDLQYLSSIFYNKDDETILPALYDKKTLFYKELSNTGSINTNKYLDFKEVPVNLFQSYIKEDGIDLYKLINNNSLLYPLFKGGEFYSCNKKFNFSSLYITDKFEYINGYYRKEIKEEFNANSISIYTLELTFPGIINKPKEFIFKQYNTSIENTFKNTSEEYLYTIVDNVIYLNIEEILYTDILVGRGDGSSRMFVLPEFPINNIDIKSHDTSKYKILNGLIIFNKDATPSINEDVVISCSISPIITYKRNSETREDIVSTLNNISPNSIGFKNGVICLYNSYNNTDLPSSLGLSVETINKLTNTYRIKASLSSLSGIPMKNKEISFNILTGGANFAETNSQDFSSYTNMSGETTAILSDTTENNGIYVQKEWVSGNIICLPEELEIEDISSTFLYIITADDPILGKLKAFNTEKFLEEYYKEADISSYYVTGRKVAFIELLNKDGKLTQKYIKPFIIEYEVNKDITFRNLFLKDKTETIIKYEKDATYQSSLTFEEGTYENASIPFNKIDLYSKTIPKATKITFTKTIPVADNIAGYLLIFNRDVKVQATYTDEYSTIKSEVVSIEIKNIKSESPFILSGINLEDKNTTLDDLGYYTVSDYIQNDYEIYPCTYGCIYSDAIDKTCLHNNEAYREFYKQDNNGVLCIHTPEYDETINIENRCPGLKAQMVNPFNLLAKGVQ